MGEESHRKRKINTILIMKTSLGFYEIDYLNGIKQEKELISKEDSVTYNDLISQKNDLEIKMSGKNKRDPELKLQIEAVKEKLKEFSFPFFVVDSPLYKAIESGVMIIDESSGNSGKYPMKITKIESYHSVSVEE
jgi:hypothetical protein